MIVATTEVSPFIVDGALTFWGWVIVVLLHIKLFD